jgi:hypothetical protein
MLRFELGAATARFTGIHPSYSAVEGRLVGMEKLKIFGVEGQATRVVLEAQFNPKEIEIQKTIPWQLQRGKGPSDLKYTGSDGRTMDCELLFDGFQSSASIQGEIDKLNRLSDVDAVLKRPPKVRIVWGPDGANDIMPRFDAVIEAVSVKYTMFDADGKPVRATANLRFREAKDITVERVTPSRLRS